MDVGLFWWYSRKNGVGDYWIQANVNLAEVRFAGKTSCFFVALLDGVESCEKIVFISVLNKHLYLLYYTRAHVKSYSFVNKFAENSSKRKKIGANATFFKNNLVYCEKMLYICTEIVSKV